MSRNDVGKNERIGATFPDLIWRVLSNRFLSIALVALVLVSLGLVSFGVIDITWGDKGIRFSTPSSGDPKTDIDITGAWRGTGQDDPPNITGASAQNSYHFDFHFEQKGTKVSLRGTYTIDGTNAPVRQVSGQGLLHGDFLSLEYDITTHSPDANTHGVMLLQFHPSGDVVKGRYISRSMLHDGIIFGSLELSGSGS
jgi:hypothetical protein